MLRRAGGLLLGRRARPGRMTATRGGAPRRPARARGRRAARCRGRSTRRLEHPLALAHVLADVPRLAGRRSDDSSTSPLSRCAPTSRPRRPVGSIPPCIRSASPADPSLGRHHRDAARTPSSGCVSEAPKVSARQRHTASLHGEVWMSPPRPLARERRRALENGTSRIPWADHANARGLRGSRDLEKAVAPLRSVIWIEAAAPDRCRRRARCRLLRLLSSPRASSSRRDVDFVRFLHGFLKLPIACPIPCRFPEACWRRNDSRCQDHQQLGHAIPNMFLTSLPHTILRFAWGSTGQLRTC